MFLDSGLQFIISREDAFMKLNEMMHVYRNVIAITISYHPGEITSFPRNIRKLTFRYGFSEILQCYQLIIQIVIN